MVRSRVLGKHMHQLLDLCPLPEEGEKPLRAHVQHSITHARH